jgi:hypothetical protein
MEEERASSLVPRTLGPAPHCGQLRIEMRLP